jgi:radical SAM superfamily enzyme YgiQ (UPF0313 family)
MIGGPQCFSTKQNDIYLNMTDFLFTGEAERKILDVVSGKHKEKVVENTEIINLNDLPIPDYKGTDFNKYDGKGVSLEFSRGCVSKCAFCMETHFWKYRTKKAERLINEIKECKNRYGVKDFRFNDSLINGNLKEFYKFVDIASKENLGIKWGAYARVNGKMDLEFIKKIKRSGNVLFSYGIESGSNKVLKDMNKNIKIEEAERNLQDGFKVGLFNHINWIIGFPTEEPIDFLYSLAFIYNNRKYIGNISPGTTCRIGPNSELKRNPEKFNIEPTYYWENYITKGFKNTAIHRFIRLKIFHIWLDLLDVFNGQKHKDINTHYNFFRLSRRELPKKIRYEECKDFSYLDRGKFSSSLYAEYVLFIWILYKVFGPYIMSIHFNYEIDKETFGSGLAKPYNAITNFSVDYKGKWSLSLNHRLETVKRFKETIRLGGNF